MGKKILVTAALPYANGPLHLGHMIEYIEADIFVRFLRLKKENVIYCCADDTHGTPIEINAKQHSMSPDEFVNMWYKKHLHDFKAFGISFDSYYSTNSKENKEYVELFFNTLKNKGYIYKKSVEQLYCEKCKRFLPDRYVRGTCPKCGAKDQYGDVCELCGATYKPTDLLDMRCAVCKHKPAIKHSEHYFFKLSAFEDKLREWLIRNKHIQEDIKSYVLEWINSGLEDWCISRDKPYFGFKIPGEDSKYFYVWMDAPIGYIASTANYCKGRGCSVDDYWKAEDSEIIHFIGKDIAYFHFLFWPAMLMGTGFNLPKNIIVHGFLTIDGAKLSKSRGTLVTVEEYLKFLNPELLRYYYSSYLSPSVRDIDLNSEEFKEKINNELVSNIANFIYRVLSFINNNFGSKIFDIMPNGDDKNVMSKIRTLIKEAEKSYSTCNLKNVVRCINEIAATGNKYFQENEPWKIVKSDTKRCATVLAIAANIVKNLVILLKPIMPNFSAQIESQLRLKQLSWSDLNFGLKNHKIAKPKIILKKIEKLAFSDPFMKLELKIGKIREVFDHPDANKLYVLRVDIGGEIRNIVAGLKQNYGKRDLLGKHIVVLTNLKHANIRGVKSEGMVLAAGNEKDWGVLLAKGKAGEAVYVEGIAPRPAREITIKEFSKLELVSKNGKVFYKGFPLRTAKGFVIADKNIDGRVR